MEPTLFSDRFSYDSVVIRWMAIEKECQVTHRVIEPYEITMIATPYMQDRDLNLVEHEPLVQYLQERYPGDPLLPADPKIRAQIRQICTLIRHGIEDFVVEMNEMLSHDNPFITGDEFTLADIYAGARLYEIEQVLPCAFVEYKYVYDYYDRLTDRVAFKEATE